ncbi:MAG: dihydrodipicolinate synthase family protein [Sphaerochaetaceae bacterium]|nr:dihydrodipicolinate synthase family protein [Sphaerochaetaceae bacterium]
MEPQKMIGKIKGPITIFPTHFNKNGDLDTGAMKTVAQYANEVYAGRDGCVMIAGSTSEFYAMTDRESLDMIKSVVDVCHGKTPVIAGTGRAATGLSLDLSLKAQDLGIDMAMITNPYYMHVSEEGLYRHFSTIAEALDIGVMIYDNPTTSKIAIPVPLMKRLSKVPNIIAVKENTSNVENYYWMTQNIDPADMVVACGIGALAYLFEAPLGCPAFISELVCFAPEYAFAIYDAAKNKDYDEMKRQVELLNPYHQFVSACVSRRNIPTVLGSELGGKATSVYQSIIKKAMEMVGLPGGIVREPLENITETETDELRSVLKTLGII